MYVRGESSAEDRAHRAQTLKLIVPACVTCDAILPNSRFLNYLIRRAAHLQSRSERDIEILWSTFNERPGNCLFSVSEFEPTRSSWIS